MNQFSKLANGGSSSVDVFQWLHWFGLEIVFHFVLNENPGMLATGQPHPIMRHLEAFQVCFAWVLSCQNMKLR